MPLDLSRIRAVIFDCDGVMFDSRRANVNFYNTLLARFGLPPMGEDDQAFCHMQTAEEAVRRIFRGTPHEAAAQAWRLRMDYAAFIPDMVMEPELRTTLAALQTRFRLAVATNRSNTIGPLLKTFALEHFFEMVVSSLDVANPKPHPEALWKICGRFAIQAAEGLYVGDSEVDEATSEGAGMPFVAYKNPGLKADAHVGGFKELRVLLGVER